MKKTKAMLVGGRYEFKDTWVINEKY